MPPRTELDEIRRAVLTLTKAQAEVRRAIRAASEAGHTQRDIADAAGVSQGKVWRILKGE